MSAQPFDLGPANAKVSPLIRLSRWSLLFAGIVYGFKNDIYYAKKEKNLAEYRAQMKPIWDAEKAKETAVKGRLEMIKLASDFGVPVPPNF